MSARDTTPDAQAFRTELHRKMTPGQRLEIAMQLSEATRQTALASIRHRHPEYDDDQARMALFRLLLGDDLFRRAYPTAPVLDP
jgi:hypothetical protein